jgi:PAS domain S-box-containing protein
MQTILTDILNQSTEKIFCVDEEYKLVYFNTAFAAHGYIFNCPEPAIGDVALPPEPASAYWRSYYARVFSGETFTQELNYYTNDGNFHTDTLRFVPTTEPFTGRRLCCIHSREITELREATRAAQRQEKKYRNLFERSLAGVFITTLDGRFVDCNDSFAKILGYETREELLNRSVYDIYFTSEERNSYLEHLKSRGVLQNYESRHKRKDGSEVWILTNVTISLDENEQPAFVEGTFIDITELKKAGELLLEREERYRQINELISDYAYSLVIKPTGEYRIAWIFGGFEQITGYKPEEIIAKESGFNEVVLQEDYDRLSKWNEEFRETGRYSMQYRIMHQDGSIRWVHDQAQNVEETKEGTVTIGAVRDITDQKHMEEEAVRTAETTKGILKNLPVGILLINQGEVEYSNLEARRLFGNESAWVMKEDVCALFPEKLYAKLCAACENMQPFRDESLVLKRAGEEKMYALEGNEIQTPEGNRYCLVIRNITTERRLAEEQTRLRIAQETNLAMELEIERHKATQKQLKGAERFSKYIIDSSIDMILAGDIYGGITEVNHAALRRFGYAMPELKGKSPLLLYADPAEYEKVFQSLEQTGVFRGEIRNITKDGEEFTSMLSASLIKNAEGYVVGAMGVSRDITEQKKADRKLLEQSSMINTIFNGTSNTLIWTFDTEFRLQSYNQNFRKLMKNRFGIKVEKGMNIVKIARGLIVKNENFQAMMDNYSASLSGKSIEFEGPLRDTKGKTIWLEVFLSPVKIGDEELKEVVALAHDITEKKLVEKRLLINDQRMKAMIEAIPDTILRVDNQGHILGGRFVSDKGAIDVFERTPLGDLFRQETSARFMEMIQDAVTMDVNRSIEFNYTHGAADLIMEARFSPINESEALVIVRDITQEKLSEDQIKESLREKEILLKEVHHRVKNNLQIISSILNLQSSYVRDENTLDILKESQNRIKSMSFIHESLYQNKNFSNILFSDYLRNLAENLVRSYQFTNKPVDLEFDIESVELNLDQAIPCGLIMNELITNSLKYAFRDTRNPAIRIMLHNRGQCVFLKVSDNGVGLPAGLDFRNTESLGLQLVVTLVEQLDGKIELENIAGTSYLITFDLLN